MLSFASHLQLYTTAKNSPVCDPAIRQSALGALQNGPSLNQAKGDETSNSSSGTSQNSVLPSSGSNDKSPGNPKRQRGKRNGGDPPDQRGEKRRSVSTPLGREVDEPRPPFACPYVLHNREVYRCCLGFPR
ncbi:hypothetical protein F4819DRAFT_493387 [Hypoxylon fuscum]|nr:hypothetical protein F4819DRAFT_493387 [Hypoxylon fuscum]